MGWNLPKVQRRNAKWLKVVRFTLDLMAETFSRFSLAVQLPSAGRRRGARTGARRGGLSASIRVGQGSEFISHDLRLWVYTRGVTLDFSRPRKPTNNAFIESFNGKLWAECLN